MEEEDRISFLQDCLLVEILSRLYSTEEAIRTSLLSKRWEHLWTLLPILIFTHDVPDMEKRSIGDFFSLVDKILTHCGTKFNLDEFQLNTYYVKSFQSQVNNCIRYAVSRNVQDLILILWTKDYVDYFELRSEFIFTNSCFTSLTLSGLKILPVGTVSWNKLTSLCMAQAILDEDLMQNILSGSPFLEYLELKYCYGIRRIDITSKSVIKFVFSGYCPREEFGEVANTIEINAPYILSLTIKHLFICKPILLNVSSLVKANLDYERRYLETMQKGAEQELLKVFILKLSHVKELKIGKLCSKVFHRLKSKGFISPSNLKIVDVAAP